MTNHRLDDYYAQQDDHIGNLDDIDQVFLDVQVRSDAAYIAQLVIADETAAADEYATSPDVADRIRRWKANRA